MSVIENIDVVMGAQTAQLDAAIAKEINQLKNFGKVADDVGGTSFDAFDFGKIKKHIAGLVASFGALGVAIGVTKGMLQEMQTIDDLADNAAKLGTSVADLRAIQFSIGETSGMDPESINQAIQKMQLSMVAALQNSEGEMAKSFEAVGLNAKALLSKGPIDAIGDIADAISELKTPAEQLEFATSVFGKSAGGIVQSLREGRGPMSEWVGYAKDYGLLISDADAEIIGMTNDSMARLGVATQGWYTQLSLLISPTMKAISDDLTSMVPKVKDSADHMWTFSAFLVSAYGSAKDLYEVFGLLARQDFVGLAFRGLEPSEALRELQKFNADHIAAQEAADQKKRDRENRQIQADNELDKEKKKRDEEEKKRIEDLVKSKRDFLGGLKEELELLKAQNEARAAGQDFDPTTFKMRREFDKLSGGRDSLEFNRLDKQLTQQRDLERQMEKLKAESNQKSDNKFGAVSAQEGSVEAYKLLLQRDNEQKQIAEEAKQQTILQQRMADLLEQANMKPTIQLTRAR
jgi:hypothetical protein